MKDIKQVIDALNEFIKSDNSNLFLTLKGDVLANHLVNMPIFGVDINLKPIEVDYKQGQCVYSVHLHKTQAFYDEE